MNHVDDIAGHLARAWQQGGTADSTGWDLRSTAEAYAVQDRLLDRLGLCVGGWKVGMPDPQGTPHCAPLPQVGLLASGCALEPQKRVVVELELAVRVARDIDHPDLVATPAALAACFDAVMPALEVVESRLAEPAAAGRLAKLADLQSHGHLVLGQAVPLDPADMLGLDLRRVQARLWAGGTLLLETTGGNPAQDLWRMLGWLAGHCLQRQRPLRKGQVVTTGSCTGLREVEAGAVLQGDLVGIGGVGLGPHGSSGAYDLAP